MEETDELNESRREHHYLCIDLGITANGNLGFSAGPCVKTVMPDSLQFPTVSPPSLRAAIPEDKRSCRSIGRVRRSAGSP